MTLAERVQIARAEEQARAPSRIDPQEARREAGRRGGRVQRMNQMPCGWPGGCTKRVRRENTTGLCKNHRGPMARRGKLGLPWDAELPVGRPGTMRVAR
jgi:hypothetical protein